MTESSSLTDSAFAFLLAVAIALPAFMGADHSLKGTFYGLVTIPTIILILTGKINLAALYRGHTRVFLLAIPLMYWSVTNLWSAHPDNFYSYFRRALTTFIYLIAVVHIVSVQNERITRYMDLSLGLVAVGAVIHLIGMLTMDTPGPVWRLGDNTIFHRSLHASHYFGFFGVYGIVRIYQQHETDKAWLYAAVALPPLLFVIMTFSRGPLISLFAVYLFIVVFWFKKYRHALLAAGVAAATVALLLEQLLKRGTSFRLEIWQGSLDLVRENFWQGVGFVERLDLTYGDGELAPHAHNLFLDIFVRSGVIGFALLLSMAGFAGYKALKVRPLEQVWVATLLFFFLCMMTDVTKVVNSPSGAYVGLWLPLAALLTLSSRVRKA